MQKDEDCRVLWCMNAELDNNGNRVSANECVTTNTRWADGTPCDNRHDEADDETNPKSEKQTLAVHRMCMNGVCVHREAEHDKPVVVVHGGWSDWGAVSACSRTCGGGVRKRYRTCDKPMPANGGRYCIGQRVLYESCNTHVSVSNVNFS